MADKLAGKYDTPEALEKGYREIRGALGLTAIPDDKKLVGEGGLFVDHKALETAYLDNNTLLEASKKKVEIKPTTTETPTLSLSPAVSDEDDFDAVTKKAGLDPKVIGETVVKDGKPTAEQYAAYKKVGFGKGLVDTALRGLAAQAGLAQRNVADIQAAAEHAVGGKEQLETLLTWARGGGVPADQFNRLNEGVQKGTTSYVDAIELLAAKHAKAVGAGNAKPLITGGAATSSGGNPKTKAEWAALQLRVQQGDAEARKIMLEMPLEEIERMK